MENSTDKRVKTIVFDNAKELIASGMKQMCSNCGIHQAILTVFECIV